MMVTVIIVNWNSGELLWQCVSCLLQQTRSPDRIVVIDNNSSDESTKKVECLPGIEVRKLDKNLGFAAGNNRAITECTTDYVALLNPDAFPEPAWLEKLLEVADANPHVAAFGSRQMVAGSDGLIDGLGDVYHFSSLAWRRGHMKPLTTSDLASCEIFSPCAGAALYRRAILEEIGGFDEDFFCYVEDVDLGFRLRLAGYRSMYVPSAVVHHIGSATSGGKYSDFSVYHGHRNLVWAYVKNMPTFLFWVLLPLHLLLNVFTLVYFALRGQGRVILSAKIDAIKGLPRIWRKRQEIQARRVVSVVEIWRILDKRLLPFCSRAFIRNLQCTNR